MADIFPELRCRGALNLVIAAIVYWNTSYMDKATDHLRRQAGGPNRACSGTSRLWAGITLS